MIHNSFVFSIISKFSASVVACSRQPMDPLLGRITSLLSEVFLNQNPCDPESVKSFQTYISWEKWNRNVFYMVLDYFPMKIEILLITTYISHDSSPSTSNFCTSMCKFRGVHNRVVLVEHIHVLEVTFDALLYKDRFFGFNKHMSALQFKKQVCPFCAGRGAFHLPNSRNGHTCLYNRREDVQSGNRFVLRVANSHSHLAGKIKKMLRFCRHRMWTSSRSYLNIFRIIFWRFESFVNINTCIHNMTTITFLQNPRRVNKDWRRNLT